MGRSSIVGDGEMRRMLLEYGRDHIESLRGAKIVDCEYVGYKTVMVKFMHNGRMETQLVAVSSVDPICVAHERGSE